MNTRSKNIVSACLLCAFGLIGIGSIDDKSSSSSNSSGSKPLEVVYNSPWDGSVKQVEDWFETNLRDPDSVQYIEWSTVIKQSDGSFIVRCKYRAKNGFGGYNVSNQVFTLSPQGTVLSHFDM